MKEQTWWNKNIHSKLNEFQTWVGDSNAESKMYIALYLKNNNHYSTIIDVGCGNANFLDSLLSTGNNIDYTGVDTCDFFVEENTKKGVKMINNDIRNMKDINDNDYDIAFSRHTLEHQEDFKEELDEMIRIASKEVCHIFFIKPSIFKRIDYNEKENLYHNQYSLYDIEGYLSKNPKVKNWEWYLINKDESAIHIYLKN